jgi:hypothetical protein
MFEFLANLSNYNPKSFKGKTVKEILAMKSSNVGADFFDPANDQAIAEAGLMGEQLDAIEMLRDLKDKTTIFEKCYKNKTQRRKMASPKPQVQQEQAQAKQEQAKQEQAQPVAEEEAPVEEAALTEDQAVAPGEGSQSGGGRRRHKSRKHKRSGSKRSGKSRKHKRSGSKCSGTKRVYSGGNLSPIFKLTH